MNSLFLILLLVTGDAAALFWQKLRCPYGPQDQNLLRFWCRQTSAECCTGLAFSPGADWVDGGRLRVTQGSGSFSVEVLEPGHRGLFWCGVLSRNNTAIKLAEGYFHSSSAAFTWSIARWFLLPLLPTATIFIYICSKPKRKHSCCSKKPDEDLNGSLADPE